PLPPRRGGRAGDPGPAPGGGVVLWWLLKVRFTLWLLGATGRVIKWLAVGVVLAAAAAVTIVAAVGYVGAWLRGWPPAKLRRAALWALPMTGVYLAGRALQVNTWPTFALAPVRDWQESWHQATAGHLLTAFALTASV